MAVKIRYVRPHLYSKEFSSLQSALSGEESDHVRKVILSGTTDITAPLVVPNNCVIEGEAGNGSMVRVPDGATFHAFDVDGKHGVHLRDFQVGHTGAGYQTAGYYGVILRGDCEDIRLDAIVVERFGIGIDISGERGTVPGTCRNIHVHRCVTNANKAFGIHVSAADGVEIVDHKAHENYLDGGKLSRMTKNVTFRGGSYCDNGQVVIQTGSGAGDGVDCFAGGDRFTIEGGVFLRNHGNGITIKTDNLTDADPAIYGYVRRIQVIGPRCNDNLQGAGLSIYSLMGASIPGSVWDDIPTMPTVQLATVLGGEYSGNPLYGLYLDGHQIAATAPICVGNGRCGILTGHNASYVTIANPVVAGNSATAVGFYPGIWVLGSHVAIRGGSSLGVTGDEVTGEDSLAAMARRQSTNVLVESTASDVSVDLDFEAYSATGVGVRTNMTSGVCVTRQRGTLVPNTSLIYGSVGSTYLKTDAADPINAAWRKTSGAPNLVGGWTREAIGAVVSTLPTASADYRDAIVTVQGGAGVADATYACRKRADETYEWQAL